jgi:ATP-dependent DNA helicase RecQ
MTNPTIDDVFQTHFSSVGSGLRPHQRTVIESVLSGHNTLCVMPTGGGKSLCYWVAGKALGGITLVVFPLTALMDEQAQKLRAHKQKVLVLHSGINWKEQIRGLIDLYRGNAPDFIFVSPERIATDGFLQFVLRERCQKIKLVVVDEIHCVSQWGLDFRPFYKEIPHFLKVVFEGSPHKPAVLGLTATLSIKDTEEICQDFDISAEHILKSPFLLRLNIKLSVAKVPDDKVKDGQFWSMLLDHRHEKVLVYVENKRSGDRSTESMCARARELGCAAAFFHADMSSEEKAEVIRQFKAGDVLMVFATSAFGMGIDIPDIRGVIHYRPPESVEQYYQQIGRVGRDGKPAWAHLFWSDKNIDYRRKQFIDKSFPTAENVEKSFETLTQGKGDIKTFNYFQETDAQGAYHYLLHSEVVDVLCKGVQNLGVFARRGTKPLPEFDGYMQATTTKMLVTTASRSHTPVQQVMEDIYRWLATQLIDIEKSPGKCLVILQNVSELPSDTLASILSDAAIKKGFRYEQLENLVILLTGFTDSTSLHQSIGRHLGIDEFQLRRVHETVSGVYVRSKSEVIVANLLTVSGIVFEYERELRAAGTSFLPDFTIQRGERTYYWEHLGMLDLEDYRRNWEIKHAWYDRNFPGQLIITEESPILSRTVEDLIHDHFLTGESSVTSAHNRRTPAEDSVDSESAPEIVQQPSVVPITCRVRVLTEGQTDWKHLKAAFTRLKQAGQFLYLDLDFQEDEQDVGDQELLRTCRLLGRLTESVLTVCVFDRDVPATLRQVVDDQRDYKRWSKQVYSVALPVPDHRKTTPDICIEFYYRDEEIKQKDARGRRLFIGTEFNSRTTRHVSEPLICTDRNKTNKFTIIDSQVYSSSSDSEENVALPKSEFAQYVLQGAPDFNDFDLSAFVALFGLIEQLARSTEAPA